MPLIILGWAAAVAAHYAFSDANGLLPLWVYIVGGLLAFNYVTLTITEKLDEIQWRLDDIERRLPSHRENEEFP